MIRSQKVGNILSPHNPCDVIIAMNDRFADVHGIGKQFVAQIRRTREIKLGAVVSFDLDSRRELHMLICHRIGLAGWSNAHQYVRYGMDYLQMTSPGRQYSIVDIGTGRVGKRDGADDMLIRTAITMSFLPVDMYILDDKERLPAEALADVVPIRPLRMWDMLSGEDKIRVAA